MIYNYKDKETIQNVIVEDFEDIVDDIVDEYLSIRRYEALKIFAPAWVAANILCRFVDAMDKIDSVHFYEETNLELLDNDDTEILLELFWDGCVFIEEARGRNGKFLRSDDEALNYVYDSFPKRDVDFLATEHEHILVFGFEDEDKLLKIYNDCDECTEDYYCNYNLPPEVTTNDNRVGGNLKLVMNESDDGMHGFTATESGDGYNMSYSFYSSEKLDMNDTMRILKMMGFGE